MEDLSKLTVAVLKKRLTERDLPTTGLKAELVARLQEAIQADEAGGQQDNGQQGVQQGGHQDISISVDQLNSDEQAPEEASAAAAGPTKQATPETGVQADAIVDARDENGAEESQSKSPTAIGAIHDAHSAGVEAVGVTDNGVVERQQATGAAPKAAAEEPAPQAGPSQSPPATTASSAAKFATVPPKRAVPLAALEPPHPATRAVRVVGLERPIIPNTIRQVARTFGELDEADEVKGGIWVDGIKREGWVVYRDVASAQALYAEFNGKPFPEAQPFRSPVSFFYVPADVVPAILSQEESLWEAERACMEVVAAVRPDGAYEFGARRRGANPSANAKGSKKERPAKAEKQGVTAATPTPAEAATSPPAAATGISILGAGRKAKKGQAAPADEPAGTGNGTIPYADASSLPPITFPPARGRERERERDRDRSPVAAPAPAAAAASASQADSLAARMMVSPPPREIIPEQREREREKASRRGARGKGGRGPVAPVGEDAAADGLGSSRYHPYSGRERERAREYDREYDRPRRDRDRDRERDRSPRARDPAFAPAPAAGMDVDLDGNVDPDAYAPTYVEEPAHAHAPPPDERTTASRSNAAAAYASRARGGDVPTGPRADRGGDREWERDARAYREQQPGYSRRDRDRGRDRDRDRDREYGYEYDDGYYYDRDRRDRERSGRSGAYDAAPAEDYYAGRGRERDYEYSRDYDRDYDYGGGGGGGGSYSAGSRGYDRARQPSPGWRMEPPLASSSSRSQGERGSGHGRERERPPRREWPRGGKRNRDRERDRDRGDGHREKQREREGSPARRESSREVYAEREAGYSPERERGRDAKGAYTRGEREAESNGHAQAYAGAEEVDFE